MSNARDMSQLINKFTPTATGVDLTGTLSTDANIELTSSSGVIQGGRTFTRVVRVHELNNSTAASSTTSTLEYDDSSVVLQYPTSDTGTDKTFNICVEAYGNARYIEDSDDPGFEPHLELYNYVTAAWVVVSDTDNVHNARYADRGTGNYYRTGYHISNNLQSVSTANYIESYATPTLRMRVRFAGVGGEVTDTLNGYYNHFRITEYS